MSGIEKWGASGALWRVLRREASAFAVALKARLARTTYVDAVPVGVVREACLISAELSGRVNAVSRLGEPAAGGVWAGHFPSPLGMGGRLEYFQDGRWREVKLATVFLAVIRKHRHEKFGSHQAFEVVVALADCLPLEAVGCVGGILLDAVARCGFIRGSAVCALPARLDRGRRGVVEVVPEGHRDLGWPFYRPTSQQLVVPDELARTRLR